MRNNKKGVSPLIATVLLIAFAVALGAIVMNWGRAYVEDTQDFARDSSEGQLKCSSDTDLSFEIKRVELNESIETENSTLQVVSTGNTDIESFVIQLFDEDGNGVTSRTNDSLDAFETRKIDFEIESLDAFENEDITDIIEINVIPEIEIADLGEKIACPNRAERKINDTDNFEFIYNS